jgi:hypothetical protein
MDSEPHDVEKQASAIAHAFFWSVAGRHQACVEQLQDISGAVPNAAWLSLCFEPLLFGLIFFREYARKRHRALEQELFMAELETATRWLLATIIFEPDDVDSSPSRTPPSDQIGQPARTRWVLTKGHERALAPFSRWCEVRQRQFQRQSNPQSDSGMLFEELKTDLARDGYRCPESLLRVFAEGVVSEAYRIRDEAVSAVLNDLFSARRWRRVEAGSHSHRPTRARTG